MSFKQFVASLSLLVPGSALLAAEPVDHRLLSGPKGGQIVDYAPTVFAQGVFPLQAISSRSDLKPEQLARVDGNITRHSYFVEAGGPSAYQLLVSYKKALTGDGYDILLECTSNATCGGDMAAFIVLSDEVMPAGFKSGPSFSRDQVIVGRKRTPTGQDIYVLEYIQPYGSDGASYVYQQILETAAGETVVQAKSADELADELAVQGWTELGGLFFAVDSDRLLDESTEAIEQIAQLLKTRDGRYFIVGHTDTTGSFDHNMQLAQRRALSVKNQLVTRHGIAATRLESHGVGPLVPVASNRAEDGRKRNRRVTLVEADRLQVPGN